MKLDEALALAEIATTRGACSQHGRQPRGGEGWRTAGAGGWRCAGGRRPRELRGVGLVGEHAEVVVVGHDKLHVLEIAPDRFKRGLRRMCIRLTAGRDAAGHGWGRGHLEQLRGVSAVVLAPREPLL